MTTLLTLAESVATHARTQPRKIGARDSKRALSYADWHTRASRLANALLSLGLQPGDRVALLAYNCVEWLEIYAALARSGLVAVPINFRLRGPEIAYIVQHAEAQAFIVQDELRGVVDGIRAELPIPAAHYLHFGADTPTGWQGYEALIDAASADAPDAQVKPKDLFALMYTSGTTGRPKGAMRSHEGNALIALVTALEFGLTRDDTGLLVMPLCHANSLYFGVTFAMLGATIVVDDRKRFDPEAVLRTLAREQVTFTSLVPTHYIMMLDLPESAKQGLDFSRVGKLLVSSAPARQETKLAILQLFPNGRLFELYGSTEAGWVTSVGREWAGSGPIRLLDVEGNEVPDGEVGELYSRTAYAFDGYWKNPDKTREAFSGSWCSVGDLARRDAQGFIHLVDRKSNMIISGGENIYPSEVESVLAAHPAVQDVAAVGLPDAKWGEAVHAVVVLRPGQSADAKAMEDWCRERMAGFKRPRGYCFVAEAELPRTATGKIQHRLLRERLMAAGMPAPA